VYSSTPMQQKKLKKKKKKKKKRPEQVYPAYVSLNVQIKAIVNSKFCIFISLYF